MSNEQEIQWQELESQLRASNYILHNECKYRDQRIKELEAQLNTVITGQTQEYNDLSKKYRSLLKRYEELEAQLQTAWEDGFTNGRFFPESYPQSKAAYIGTLTDRTVYGEAKTQLCPECQLPKEAHIRGEFCGENKKATEELLNEVAKEYATNGSYQEWLKLPTSPFGQEGDFAKTARCFKSGMREIISNPTKYGLTSATEVSEEQLQKEVNDLVNEITDDNCEFRGVSTVKRILKAYIAGCRQSAVQDKKDTL